MREHKDRTFGKCAAQSRLVRGEKGADGKVRPVFEVQTEPKEEKIKKFLRGEITVDGEEDVEGGFLVDDVQEKDGVTYPEGEGLWLHSFVRSEEAPWTAEQVCTPIILVEKQSIMLTVVTDLGLRDFQWPALPQPSPRRRYQRGQIPLWPFGL